MSLVVGLMSAFVPTAGAMAVDWSGPRAAKPDTSAALAKAISGDLAQASEVKPLRFAEGGLGRYRGSIDWFEWGNPGTIIPAGGMTQTNTREVADGTLETTCTVGAPTGGPLRVQRPGTFEGDGLDDLYNIGGTGLNNQLASGLANQNGGDTVTFDFDCSVTLDGVDVPLAGLVMADAEASDQSTGEYVQATAPQGANWRIIDRYRPSDCGTNAAIVRTGNTLRMAGAGTPSCSTYPTGVAFMEGASSAVASVYGSGRSAIALGVMLFTDFGDAPESYGDAGSLYSPGFTGTTVPAGQSTLFGPALSTVGQPATRLGAAVTSEQASQPSADAAADADDAVAAPGPITVLPGTTYTLPGIACTGPGFVNGWIDWNVNGTFDEGEGAEPVACTGGTVSLSWTIPADAQTGASFLRLRVGVTAADVSSPVGVTTAGEVEDYPVALQASDFGDAPDSYGTTLAEDGARHLVVSGVTLGDAIDFEADGQPSADALGDDENGVADEDGVSFNPDLGYSSPTLRTGLDPVSLQPLQNTLEVDASADGFVSAWVDWNQDGAFSEDERVANAQPVTAGVNDVTFSQGTSPASIDTMVRVRYSTDAASIATPTGAAPDGEVEDYQVLIERLVTPDVCTASGEEYYAFTYRDFANTVVNAGAPGSVTRYEQVSVVGGIPVDMVVEVLEGQMVPSGTAAANGFRIGEAGGIIGEDDARWQVNRDATIRYTFVEAGTDDPIDVNAVYTVSDMDGDEVATFSAADLAGFAVTTGSAVEIIEDGDQVRFAGNGNWNGDPQSRFQFVLEGLSTFDVRWQGGMNSGFGYDGDGDLSIDPPACSDFGDAPDSYGTTLENGGASHLIIPGLTLGETIDFDTDGQPTDDALGDDETRLADEDGVADAIEVTAGQQTTVSVSATNGTAEVATLAGWIDLDGSGTFDAGELASVEVPANSGTATYELTFPAPTESGDSFARFRLFSGAVAAPSPIGEATGGEVEDYTTTFVAGPPIFLSCSALTTFDEDNAGWRAATTSNGTQIVTPPQPVGWAADAGNPGGAIIERDLDGQWTELWTPPLLQSGYATDYSPALGEELQFDYRNDTGIDVDLYVGVVGANGSFYWYNFRDQIVDSTQWTRVIVPLVASEWQTQFDDATGPVGPAPTEEEFLAALSDVDRFTFSIEGRTGQDTTAFDNFGQPCEDFGDAPASYGTEIAGDGPRHQVIGFVDDTNAAPLMLGTSIDIEDSGVASDAADSDDTTGIADEDGVADEIVVTVGEETDVTVSVTNDTDEAATLAGWIDLDGNGSFDAAELVTLAIPADSGTADYVLTFPAGTVTADTYARFRVFPGAVDAPLPTGAAAAGEVEDYVVTVNDRELEIEKSSDMTVDSRPGDEVTYTVTVTNTGSGDYTDEFPAVVFDDLSGVLDDATYNGDATAVASDGSDIDAPSFIPESFLSWSGPLAAGESVTIEYTVTLTGGGDGTVRNVAWQPPTPPPPGVPPTEIPTCDPRTDEGTDPVTGEVCAVTEGELPKLVIEKTSDSVDLPADGGTVTYTVTVTNEGPGDFTADEPATMTDDLSGVLDDAVFGEIIAPASGAVFDADEQELTWAGALAAGESVEVTYTVTYDSTAGDQSLVNVACVPEDLVLDPDQDCQIVQVPAAALTMDKTVDPADGTVVVAGQEVTYTLTFTNTGQTAAAVDAIDDLSGVLDDATLTAGPTAQDGLTATLDGDQLAVTGSVPVGETRTVTYTVTVDDFAGQGDHVLGNVLGNADGTCPPGGCPDTENPIRHYTVEKEAVADDAQVNPGDVLTYTVTVVNDGGADYTVDIPAAISDDLSAVLDDATYNGDAVAVVTGDDSIQLPAPSVDGITLDWAGPIAVGQTVTITYSVTVNDPRTGDGELTNAVLPNGPGGECAPGDCLTETPLQFYTVAKAASATTVIPGDTITYTVTVTNGSAVDYTADAPASFEDDLSAVLDDATYNDDATNGAVVDGSTLSWTGAVAAGESVTITYSVTVNDPSTGDDVLTNAVVPTGPGGECEPDECGTVTPVRSYSVTKEASAAIVQPGDVVTYTVTVTNTGAVDYTDDAPASLTDDLSAVLDDATYNDDATSGATVDGETLSWQGALPVGETVTITYSVTVNAPNTGDGVLTNAVVPGEPGGSCEPAESCTTTTDVRSYTVSKTASSATVQPGDTITYEVVVTNTGNVDYTEDAPASFTDDLSEVLDDASYNDDATEGATVSGSTLLWEGALAVGETVTITYSVTVNSPNTGDDVLTNAVVPNAPGGSCDPDAECITTTPIQSFSVTKSADATDVVPGDVITYTLTVVNTGQAAYTADSPASLTDDMSAVLDDATYNGDATNGAVYDEPTLSWEGPLEIGETVTITYSVTVNDPATGDGQLDNAVVTENGGNCEPGSNDPDCIVEIPSGSYSVTKEVSATTAMPGDVITYTVTVTNTGDVAYTEDEPASFEDNLANVLDDATYNDDASNGAVVDGTTLSWEGPLAVGEVVTVTYSVTVNDAGTGAGDRNLGNVVVPTSPGGDCLPEESCETNTPIGEFEVSKTSSGAGEVLEGDVITYTITVANTSEVDFTADEPASFTDDLSAVLDDATYNDDATNGATVDGDTLSWEGPLAAGESIEITYSVTVGEAGAGDGILTNGVVPGDGGACVGDCTTEDALRAYTVTKTSSAGGAVVAGDIVTYTVTVTNTGAVDYTEDAPASLTDDLSAVLDDATYNGDATNGATVNGSTLTWAGPLAAGESIEISYSVTVGAAGTGDGVLTNAVVPTEPGGSCDPDGSCTTTDELQSFTVEKSVSSTVVYPGDELTYTITVTNTGAAAFTADVPAVITDDLSEVLDDADYNGDATNGAVYTEPELSWALALEPGETVVLTYSVTVHDPSTGDLQLRNAVDPSSGGECVDDESCLTETLIASYAVEKVVNTASTAEGDTVTYTITVTNTGAVDFTEENPASFTDDLSEVLDDAVYNGDATNGAVYSEPVLSWEGAVEVGGTVTVTYSVTVNAPATGDRELLNAVEPGLGGSCGEACMTTTDITDGLPATGLDPRVVGYGAAAALAAILAGLVLLVIRRRQTVTE